MKLQDVFAIRLKYQEVKARRSYSALAISGTILIASMAGSELPSSARGYFQTLSAGIETGIVINRNSPVSFEPSSKISWTANPSTEEIESKAFFPERLIPLGAPSIGENAALARAITAYSQDSHRENVDLLVAFIQQYPNSVWAASLNLNIGLIERKTGYYSKALTSWQASWDETKNSKNPGAQLIADSALGELSALLSSLGRTEALRPLLKESQDRPLYGSSLEKVVAAREGLWLMENKPGESFKCGPYALGRILAFQNPKKAQDPLIRDASSGANGFSLATVKSLSDQLHMGLQMAKKSLGAPILVPSVIHWKVGHYAAVLKRDHGYYVVQDPTFGNEVSISQKAIDEEGSGYFLVPSGSLPSGWQSVSLAEAKTVWGRGQVNTHQPDATKPGDPQCKPCTGQKGMAQYNIFAMLCSLHLQDQPIGYTPPVGPSVNFVATFNQFEANQPASFNYSNLGPLWIHNWMSYVVTPGTIGQTTYINLRGGGRETYNSANYVSTSTYPGYVGYFSADTETEASLWVTTTGGYERRLPDGSKEVYTTSNGAGYIFLNKAVDPQGNADTLAYDGSYRLTGITDALGQVTTFSYTLTGDPLKITKVTDPFGRFTTLSYTSAAPYQLISITDEVGITSQVAYSSGSTLASLTTPYGTTLFNQTFSGTSEAVRSIEVIDPLGAKEFYMSRLDGVGIGSSEPMAPSGYGLSITNTYLNYRDTYFWNKKAVMDYGETDYTKAQIFHFLHTPDGNSESPVLESTKLPLESRVWFNYQGQTDPVLQSSYSQPSIAARIMSDGTTQAFLYTYNSLGNVTQTVDPLGRTLTFDYDPANNIDILDVRQTRGSNNDALLKCTYNTTHCPLTIIDSSGQTTTNTFNSNGQLTKITNAKGEVTTLTYTGTNGTGTGNYLTKIIGPAASGSTGDSTTYQYDAIGRLISITDSQGYLISYSYDNLDRLTSITYPDGTYEQNYYLNIDLIWHKDRLNRWSHNVFDALERPISITDPLGRSTLYSWCMCGALTSLTDPAGNVTSWIRDVESRPIEKTFADGSRYQYFYDSQTSRLQSSTDPKGQQVSYSYNLDDTIKSIAYSNTDKLTPTISYYYDPNYRRITSVASGTVSNSYTYNPYTTYSASWPTAASTGIGQLASDTPTLANAAITYSTYDPLDRLLSYSVNGSANTTSLTYDTLSRAGSITNLLGTFTNSYLSTTSRLSSVSFPHGVSASLLYFGSTGDERLQEIKYTNSSSGVISKFDYNYNSAGDITTWQRQSDSSTPTSYALSYDAADQLSEALLTQSGSTVHRYAENYNSAGNRTSEQIDLSVNSGTFNNLNEMTGLSGGGPLRLSGTLNQLSSVTLNGSAISPTPSTNFTGLVPMTVGTNVVTVVAQDMSGLAATNRYQIVIPPAGVSASRQYDGNGNLISDGARTYEWDGADRLVAINYGTIRSEFTYDGLSRRIQIVEKNNGSVTATRQFVWVGSNPVEERDASDTVQKRFFNRGEQISGNNYYFTQDHLGSVREMLDTTGSIQARYDYDPYGRVTKVSGSLDSDFRFDALYFHQPSGMCLTQYRAYDSNTGRWLSRDPMGENFGINLYSYVSNNPSIFTDPLGLHDVYQISTGVYTHVDDQTGQQSVEANNGYSGAGTGLNNPSAQGVPGAPNGVRNPNAGPIPAGTYTIQPGHDTNLGRPSLRLTPNPGTVIPTGRDPSTFLIHADTSAHNHSASEGCIVLPDAANRQAINRRVRHGDNQLIVIP